MVAQVNINNINYYCKMTKSIVQTEKMANQPKKDLNKYES